MSHVSLKSSNSTLRILRKVPDERAFYFYLAIDRPANRKANSLEEFLESLRTIEITSIQFHLVRGDFEKWIGMLGDQTLVQSISELRRRETRSEELRKRLSDSISNRISRLQRLEH